MSATAQTLKTPRQDHLSLPVRLKSRKSSRGISVASLRPGDWIERTFQVGTARNVTASAVVAQNWASLGKIEVERPLGNRETWFWVELEAYEYVGQGRRRWWWPLLPEVCKRFVSEFSRP